MTMKIRALLAPLFFFSHLIAMEPEKKPATLTTFHIFTQLPPEIQFHCLKFLTIQDTLNFSLTSKENHKWLNDLPLWIYHIERSFPTKNWHHTEHAQQIGKHIPALRKITQRYRKQWLNKLSHLFPGIQIHDGELHDYSHFSKDTNIPHSYRHLLLTGQNSSGNGVLLSCNVTPDKQNEHSAYQLYPDFYKFDPSDNNLIIDRTHLLELPDSFNAHAEIIPARSAWCSILLKITRENQSSYQLYGLQGKLESTDKKALEEYNKYQLPENNVSFDPLFSITDKEKESLYC